MIRVFSLMRVAAKPFALVIFSLLLSAWGVVVVYTIGKLFSGGVAGVERWYLHVSLTQSELFLPSDSQSATS
jgi:hypothetical protein